MSLAKILRADKRYKKVVNILESAQRRINVDRDRSEAFALHAGLEVRSLQGKRLLSTSAIISATAQIQANRSRLVEIRARSTEHVSYLEEACKAFRKYALTKYADEFKSYRTKDERDSILYTVLKPSMDFVSEVSTLTDILDMFIKDLDQSGHTVRHIIDILKLLDSSKTGKTI